MKLGGWLTMLACLAGGIVHAAVQSDNWLSRTLVGSIVAVNEDGTLSIKVADEPNGLPKLAGTVTISQVAPPLGTRVFRLAGTEVVPALNPSRLETLRDWLVGAEVRLQVGRPFSANDAPEPVPAVVMKLRGNDQINEQFVRRGFGQVRVDEPEAIGAYEWSRIVAAAQHR